VIFHGTDAKNIDGILARGLLPWNEFKERTNWEAAPTRPGMVYLSDVYGLYYGQGAGDDNSDMALLEIDESGLDPTLFYPDEDFIVQVFSDARAIGEEIPRRLAEIERIQDLTKEIDPLTFQSMTGTCRVYFGNVCYNGTIPASSIRRHTIIPYKGNSVLYALGRDPAVSILNSYLVGDRYRSLCDFSIAGKKHPLAAVSLREYLEMPSVLVETATPGVYDRVDGLTRERECKKRGVEENKEIAAANKVKNYHANVRKWNQRAKAIYEASILR
jgi:hypothetical protein